LIDRIADRVEELSETVLEGIEPAEVERMLSKLGLARENLKHAIDKQATDRHTPQQPVKRYG
jgi:hypothetical protein